MMTNDATTPREFSPTQSDSGIVKVAIYPPIGICRVGNSPDEFYIGPEVPDPQPLPPGSYRDAQGRLKRQAARFRIYGLDAQNQPVQELTADDAAITWAVTVANQKAAWYEFQLALDIPEAADAIPSFLRNPTVSDRAALSITPASRQITGRERAGREYAFDDGKFMGKSVYLGELRTDESGRLIVLGGYGHSASYNGQKAITFGNNMGWHDDVSDGPVTAKVIYQGVELEVDPAWIVCAPPNYGPQIKSVRTMWDVMVDVAIQNQWLPQPDKPSFQQHIRPIFERLTQLQWVNQGFAAGFGYNSPFDFSTRDWLERLNDPSSANQELRRVLNNTFRHFDVDAWSPAPWPWLYGDAVAIPAAQTPRQNTELSQLQLWALAQWVVGNFDADYDPDHQSPNTIEDYPMTQQPDALTQAAMEFCLADAFHPGCEMTWPMRLAGMYTTAFRLKHRDPNEPEVSYGIQLTSSVLNLPDGPIQGGQSPGSITRWMAVPWQTDTASCRSGYDKTYDPYLPTFWPARVPNQVLSKDAYAIVINTELPLSQRLDAFANRANWLAPLGLNKSYTDQINTMIDHFDQMGVVEVQPGLPDDPNFPDVMQVSDQADVGEAIAASEQTDLSMIEKLNRFPHGLKLSRGL
jgi:hypothetical protein